MPSPGAQYRGHDDAESLSQVEEVWQLVAQNASPLAPVRLSLHAARGLRLAEQVLAADDDPPFDRVMVDGYAVRADDVCAVPALLRVIGEIRAGHASELAVRQGTAIRINTGAPLPPGADSVVMIERTADADNQCVRVLNGVRSRQNVAPRGAYMRAGSTVLHAGTLMKSAHIGAAAAAGAATVVVHPRPGVALLVTGDEITPTGHAPRPGHIRDSNGPAIAALLTECGAQVASQGIAPDDVDSMRDLLAQALQSQIVVVVGGMSMGTRDLAPRVLESLGVRWLVHGINMRPGRPAAYGIGPERQHVLGLPGNPAGAYVTAHLFAGAVIRCLCGARPEPVRFAAMLSSDIPSSHDHRAAFMPARWHAADGRLHVTPLIWRGSGDAMGLAAANAIIQLPTGGGGAKAGDPVTVLPFESSLDPVEPPDSPAKG